MLGKDTKTEEPENTVPAFDFSGGNITLDSESRRAVGNMMPDKNKTSLAKTPLFSRFLSNSRLKYVWYVCTRLYQKSSKISAFWLLASLTADF